MSDNTIYEPKEITAEEAAQIIETQEPRGQFYVRENGTYTGIDNLHGGAFTEPFGTLEDCLYWLENREAVAWEMNEPGTNSYQERRQARIDYYREKAAKLRGQSDAMSRESTKMISAIPMGQPLLVDHYSYKSDRNYRDRAYNKMKKSVELGGKAAYYAEKAEAAENNTAISSDDPEALQKLREKLAGMEKWQQEMKALNAYFRKHGTCVGAPGLADDIAKQYDDRIANDYSWCKQPFPTYELTNNNQNIKRVRDRVIALEKRELGYIGWDFAGGKAAINTELNRLQLFFDAIPEPERRKKLKSNGFVWSRSNQAWQRQLNDNAIYAAGRIDFLAPTCGKTPSQLQPKKERPDPVADLKKKQQQEINDFPMFFAFNDGQLAEGMQRLGVGSAQELCSIGGGGFVRATDADAFVDLLKRHKTELRDTKRAAKKQDDPER